MTPKIYLSPERRPAPHGSYFGYPNLYEHDVTTAIARKTAEALTRGVCRWFGVSYLPPQIDPWQQKYLSLRQSLQALLEEHSAQI